MNHQPWWRSAVFYQIYVRSFRDSDGDGIGDLKGITAQLDHFKGASYSLGVDAIWLTPFYPSPGADFGYDITDHSSVDPALGDLADLRTLLNEAHRRGIRVIVDWVANHTSIEHPWFAESRSTRMNPKRDWYVWRQRRDDGRPPNNWMADFEAVGRAWTLDALTDEWYLHSFTPSQPDLDWDNPAVREAMIDVLRFWLDFGVDGFRMDVINKIGKDPNLADNPVPLVGPGQPPTGRRHDEDWPTTFDRIRQIRRATAPDGSRALIGEVYVLDQHRLARYLRPGLLDMAHNFVFLNQPWRADAFRSCVDEFMSVLPKGASPTWCLNNHDHSRVATRYGDAVDGGDRVRVAATMLLTLPGAGFIYQGEELGLSDLAIGDGAALDVDGRDRSRGPQPWAAPSVAGAGAGFTAGRPWLPVGADAETRNVADQRDEPTSVLNLYRDLIELRRAQPALRDGAYGSVDAGAEIFAFLRTSPEQTILVALNFSELPHRMSAHDLVLSGEGRVLVGTRGRPPGARIPLRGLMLDGHEALVVEVESGQ